MREDSAERSARPIVATGAAVASHLAGAIVLLYIGVRSLPLLFISAMIFDAPGSETKVIAWLIFVVVLAAPFVALVLAILMLVFAVLIPFDRRARRHPFRIAVDSAGALYVLAVVISPMRQLVI